MEEHGMIYRYATLERPPAPGAIPRAGLLACGDQIGHAPSGRHMWGWAEYRRKLTEEELHEWEMEYMDKRSDGPEKTF